MAAVLVRPGIVVIRNLLTDEEQRHIIEIVEQHGNLKKDGGAWNFFGIRGRTFDSLNNYPESDQKTLQTCFERMRKIAEQADANIPIAGLTHLLTWWYPDQKGMGWHKDGYGGNDGDEDAPVYSLTVGNSCIFQWHPVDDETLTESAELRSGDAIVFGGPQRMMFHRVQKVLKGTFPGFDARINITFRKLAGFTPEDEKRFQTDVYQERIIEERSIKK